MPTEELSGPAVVAGPTLLGWALGVLEGIEALDADQSGRISFGLHGAILVQQRRVCWAVAADMRQRLTDRLRRQRNPPLERAQLEAVFEECKRDGTPVGQVLVASGLVSAEGLRAALFRHTIEAVVHLARAGARRSAFVTHRSTSFDERFAFAPIDVLAGLGERSDYVRGALARTTLGSAARGLDAFAFVRVTEGSRPMLVAVQGCRSMFTRDLLDAAGCATGLLDVAGALGEKVRATDGWFGAARLVAWRFEDLCYAVVCEDEGDVHRLKTWVERHPSLREGS